MVEIGSRDDLEDWLKDKPSDWAQIIAVRAAMRILPFTGSASKDWLKRYALLPIRANAISWAARIYPAHDMANAAANAAYAAADAAANAANADAAAWRSVSEDCRWLSEHEKHADAVRVLTGHSLWREQPSVPFDAAWKGLRQKLLTIDASYAVWIEWFDRRIKGEAAMFDIPGDTDRAEDQQILIRLADASNEDFWDRGANYVNTTLQGWIDEARARAAPPPDLPLPEPPPQDASAIAYGINAEGKIDRLPASDQQHLRDLPDQRLIYADVRDAFNELKMEGQRLGERLASGLDRICQSLPERFEDAEAYPVWRDGNRLRRIYLAHRSVAKGHDPDPARLEAAVAEQLGGALDLFNLFALGDDGLRAKDQATIPPQERASGEVEAAKARPVIEAILATPQIATPRALDDMQATVDDLSLPTDDPYAPQTIDQTARTWRNVVAALLTGARNLMVRTPRYIAKSLLKGVETAPGTAIFTDFVGLTNVYGPVLQFIAANASTMSAYAATAFTNLRIDVLIDSIVRFVRGN